jgi:hypothetical protein
MRGSWLCLLAIVLVSYLKSSAQTYSTGHEGAKGEVNFTEVANYELAHPPAVLRRYPFDEDEENEQPDRPAATGSDVHMIRRSAARSVNGVPYPSYLPASPAPIDTFLSTISNGGNIPPDTHGAVDSNYCVTAINSAFHIQKRSGGNVSTASLDGFWGSLITGGIGAFDPRVHYDVNYHRWIMVSDAVNQSNMFSSTLLIAVSKTSNPTGKWWTYSIPIDPTNAAWLDFPDVGYNNKWVVITGNFFANTGGGQTGAAVYVFNYNSLMTGAGAPFTKISQSSSFTICPVLTYDATEPNLFCVNAYNSGAGQLQLWKITGAVNSPVMTSIGNPTTTQHWHGAEPGNTDYAPQRGSANRFDEGDNRITSATFRNHKIWCAHTVWLPDPGSTNRSSIMWWQIDTFANPLQNGLIDNQVGPQFYAYPSIAVNQNDDALVGFSAFSATSYASGAYALHMHTDPADSMRPINIFRHGQTTYFQNFGGGKDRWGDYSATCIDPLNNLDFWTIQESVPSTPANYWDTWWAYVSICPANATFSLSNDTINALTSETITYTGTNPTGTTFAWTFGGGTAVPGTGVGPQVISWTSSGWKVVTVTVSVPGCSTTFTDSVYVNTNVGINAVNYPGYNVNIAPNPSDGSFAIVFDKPLDKQATVRIADMLGRVVYSNDFAPNNTRIPVTVNNLSTGTYTVSIIIDGAEITKKITINR